VGIVLHLGLASWGEEAGSLGLIQHLTEEEDVGQQGQAYSCFLALCLQPSSIFLLGL